MMPNLGRMSYKARRQSPISRDKSTTAKHENGDSFSLHKARAASEKKREMPPDTNLTTFLVLLRAKFGCSKGNTITLVGLCGFRFHLHFLSFISARKRNHLFLHIARKK